MMSRFLQIHTLTSYPATLLNRDDVGFAKRLPFGGVTRLRISSQCLKRHWRTFEGEHALQSIKDISMSIRSRLTFEREIRDWMVKEENIPPELATAATEELKALVLGQSEKTEKTKRANEKEDAGNKAKKKRKDEAGEVTSEHVSLRTNQITVFGRPELEYFRKLCIKIVRNAPTPEAVKKLFKELSDTKRSDKNKKRSDEERERWPDNIKRLGLDAGLDAALFGRMVTSDILARCDAAIHVAHAFTVHGEEVESDYFSAVDDLLQADQELGSGHINSAELTSGLYYGYVVIDVPLLVSNLEGGDRKQWMELDRTLAAEVVRRVVHLVATVSPGAKKGSTAPYAYAHLVYVEVGSAQPRTLANAFVKPIRLGGDLIAETYKALAQYVSDLDRMYGKTTERRLAAIGPVELLRPLGDDCVSVEDLASWASESVKKVPT